MSNRLRGGTGRRRRKASDFKFSPGGLLSEVSALVSRLPTFSPPAALSLSGYRAEGTFLDSEVLDWAARELIALAGVDIKLLTVHDTMNIALTPPEDLDRSVKDDLRKSAFIALGFDGPQLGGHFYLLVRMGPGTPLSVPGLARESPLWNPTTRAQQLHRGQLEKRHTLISSTSPSVY